MLLCVGVAFDICGVGMTIPVLSASIKQSGSGAVFVGSLQTSHSIINLLGVSLTCDNRPEERGEMRVNMTYHRHIWVAGMYQSTVVLNSKYE